MVDVCVCGSQHLNIKPFETHCTKETTTSTQLHKNSTRPRTTQEKNNREKKFLHSWGFSNETTWNQQQQQRFRRSFLTLWKWRVRSFWVRTEVTGSEPKYPEGSPAATGSFQLLQAPNIWRQLFSPGCSSDGSSRSQEPKVQTDVLGEQTHWVLFLSWWVSMSGDQQWLRRCAVYLCTPPL